MDPSARSGFGKYRQSEDWGGEGEGRREGKEVVGEERKEKGEGKGRRE